MEDRSLGMRKAMGSIKSLKKRSKFWKGSEEKIGKTYFRIFYSFKRLLTPIFLHLTFLPIFIILK